MDSQEKIFFNLKNILIIVLIFLVIILLTLLSYNYLRDTNQNSTAQINNATTQETSSGNNTNENNSDEEEQNVNSRITITPTELNKNSEDETSKVKNFQWPELQLNIPYDPEVWEITETNMTPFGSPIQTFSCEKDAGFIDYIVYNVEELCQKNNGIITPKGIIIKNKSNQSEISFFYIGGLGGTVPPNYVKRNIEFLGKDLMFASSPEDYIPAFPITLDLEKGDFKGYSVHLKATTEEEFESIKNLLKEVDYI